MHISQIFTISPFLFWICNSYKSIIENVENIYEGYAKISLSDVLTFSVIPEVKKSVKNEKILICAHRYELIAFYLAKIIYIVTDGNNQWFINKFNLLKQKSSFKINDLLELIDFIGPNLKKKKLFVQKFNSINEINKIEKKKIIHDKITSSLFAAVYKRKNQSGSLDCPISRLTPDAVTVIISHF